jgi:hypothetical protein
MQSRFQRGKVRGVSPFFAFQDIITSAMAVLITVVMLLALDLRGGGDARFSGLTPDALEKRWHEAVAALGDATLRLRHAQDAVVAAKLDPARLEGDIHSLRAELDALQARSEAHDDQLGEARRRDGSAVAWSEIAKERALVESSRAALAELGDKVRQGRDDLDRAQETVQFRENELTTLVGHKNEIWLIPERTPGRKEPVLAIVSSAGVTLRRFDHSESLELSGFDQRSRFETALRNYSKADQYFVFYFKPSGFDSFEALTGAARRAGFEIGYDAVAEDTLINFGSVR